MYLIPGKKYEIPGKTLKRYQVKSDDKRLGIYWCICEKHKIISVVCVCRFHCFCYLYFLNLKPFSFVWFIDVRRMQRRQLINMYGQMYLLGKHSSDNVKEAGVTIKGENCCFRIFVKHPTKYEPLLYSLEHAAGDIGFYVNSD